MTFTVNPWVVIVVLSLALFGVVFVWRVARDAARDARAWWRDQHEPGTGEAEDYGAWPESTDDAPFEDLPPERSAKALGFTGQLERLGLPADHDWDPGCRVRGCPVHGNWDQPPPESAEVRQWRGLEARRERLASAAELEHRAAYEAMGLDYPSGLMARVREAAP